MSTLSGVLLGIAAAAAVTVLYGDTLNQKMHDLMRDAEVKVHAAAAALDPVEVKAPRDADHAPDQILVSAEPPLAEPEDSTLAKKWQEFAGQSGQLQAVGDFQWRECFQRASATYRIPEPLLLAVASGESSFDSTARSDKDAIGLMQIRWPETSRHLGINREADLYDPCTNVSAGARYLAELSERYQQDLHRAIAAYNYGPGRIDGGPLPPGAQWYSQYIYQHLQRVLGRADVSNIDLLPEFEAGPDGYQVLMSFNQPYRARDFMNFLQSQEPGISLARRTETLGRYEVIMLYRDDADRQRGLAAVARSGLVTLN